MKKQKKVHARYAVTTSIADGGFTALCGARDPIIAKKADEITCATCLGWPNLVKEAYRCEGHEL